MTSRSNVFIITMGLVVCGSMGAASAAENHVASSHATQMQVTARWPIGGEGGWDYLTLDQAAHRLYVTRSDHVAVVDTRSGKQVGEVTPTNGVHGVALAPNMQRGFASNGRGDSVTVFDLKTLATLTTIPIEGHNPDSIVFDAPSGQVFTFNGHSQDATVIDARTSKVVATIKLSGKPEFAVSDDNGHIYVNIEDRSELTEIDTHANKAVATWPLTDCEEPSGLAFDRAHQRLFSVCQNGHMAVTDAKSGRHVATIAIGKGPDAAAFDPRTQEVFSSNGSDGTLTIIHEDSPDQYRVTQTVTTQKSARTMALDQATHRVYLAAAEFGPAPAPVAGEHRVRPPMKPDSFTILVVSAADTSSPRGH